jgi:hypothetical protein
MRGHSVRPPGALTGASPRRAGLAHQTSTGCIPQHPVVLVQKYPRVHDRLEHRGPPYRPVATPMIGVMGSD